MSGEEFAQICFAARPLLWALAIIAIIIAAAIFWPRISGSESSSDAQNS
jgi:hypothetical protein